LLVGWFVYWLNQYTVRKELEPRQRELQSLLASLDGNEPAKEPPRDGSTSDPRWRDVLRIVLGLAIGAAIAFLVYQLAASEPEAERTSTSGAATSTSAYGDAAVTNVLIRVLKKHDMPAMAAAVVTGKESSIVGVAGTRKRGTEIAATLDDKWHLGSDGKAMTATLVARLVEKDRLKWDTTLAQVFPDLADKFHPDFRTVTVLQLLQHRSGLPENPKLSDYWGADGQKERQRLVQNELAKRPKNKPGEEYEYSNLGYAIVGAITEKITGKSWEQTMRDEVFGPLGMNSVGFGGTGTPGQIDQPWGHSENGRAVYKNGPEMDNPPALSPAGRVHCTIQDWAKFVTDHLRGARGEPALLKASSYVTLHTPPPGGRYACGWAVSQRNWAGGTTLHHTGDNTMNVANVWIAPKRDFAVLVCVNQTGDKAFKASDDAIGQLIQLHSKGGQ
jgi:CubicO group peptidase (beta-lactamase class C family)